MWVVCRKSSGHQSCNFKLTKPKLLYTQGAFLDFPSPGTFKMFKSHGFIRTETIEEPNDQNEP